MTLGEDARTAWALLGHHIALFCLRIQSIAFRFRRKAGDVRILATACWHFPIYSQTFVYQELLALMRRGHRLRMVYCEARPRSELGTDFRPLWGARCRMSAEHAIRRRDFDHFARTVPDRVEAVFADLARETGRPAADLRDDPQVLQAFSFARIAKAYGADYIHSYFFYEGTLFAFVAARLLGVPRGVSCYADHMLQDHPLKLVPFHVRDADIVIATSRRIRGELVDLAGTDPGTILVKPNAVDLATLRRPAVPDRAGGGLRIVTISRIDPKKGLEYLVEAARLLLDAGVPVTVEVLGGVDAHSAAAKDYADRLRQRIAELRLEDAVRLRGVCTRTEVRAALARAHVFALPAVELGNNDKDGIPTALLEAMAMGLAVVATEAGSITEVIEPEVNGLLVPQRDAAALADALARLAGDEDARRTFGAAAERTIAERYDVTVCEPAFHEQVARVLRPRPPPVPPWSRRIGTGLAALARTARTPDWFAYKIPPLLAVAYAGLLVFGVAPLDGLAAIAPPLWGILLAGAYGHAINDLTDMEEDRRAGKRNTMTAVPPRLRVPAVALLAALGLGPLVLFAQETAPVALVAGIYALSTLYSVPPVRLKCRGVLGVLADASAAHLLPSLAIALTAVGGAAGPAATAFVVSAAVWSLAAGLRGIIVHQIIDRSADRRSRVMTFAGRLRNKRLRALVLLFVFPLEVAGLAVFLGLAVWAEPWLALAVAGWLTLEWAKIRRDWRLPIFYPGRRVERYLPLLNNEFHEVYLPGLLLAGLCLHDVWYLPLFALHLVVFSGNIAARLAVARKVLADAR
ncbi:MAG TPA: glycosyltransferase [Azospirillum sp.]